MRVLLTAISLSLLLSPCLALADGFPVFNEETGQYELMFGELSKSSKPKKPKNGNRATGRSSRSGSSPAQSSPRYNYDPFPSGGSNFTPVPGSKKKSRIQRDAELKHQREIDYNRRLNKLISTKGVTKLGNAHAANLRQQLASQDARRLEELQRKTNPKAARPLTEITFTENTEITPLRRHSALVNRYLEEYKGTTGEFLKQYTPEGILFSKSLGSIPKFGKGASILSLYSSYEHSMKSAASLMRVLEGKVIIEQNRKYGNISVFSIFDPPSNRGYKTLEQISSRLGKEARERFTYGNATSRREYARTYAMDHGKYVWRTEEGYWVYSHNPPNQGTRHLGMYIPAGRHYGLEQHTFVSAGVARAAPDPLNSSPDLFGP